MRTNPTQPNRINTRDLQSNNNPNPSKPNLSSPTQRPNPSNFLHCSKRSRSSLGTIPPHPCYIDSRHPCATAIHPCQTYPIKLKLKLKPGTATEHPPRALIRVLAFLESLSFTCRYGVKVRAQVQWQEVQVGGRE